MPLELKLPESLMYPVEITKILVSSGEDIKRGQQLLAYKYWNRSEDGIDEDGNEILSTREFYASFESPLDGRVVDIDINPNDRINGADSTIMMLEEACDHSVQYGGLCAICGISLDQKDYMGYSELDRAPISMSHGTQGLKVSRDEAEQLENASTKGLIDAKKLILIVDLDQTIIHAAVDPNIGQWINDKSSPNHEAVKDVRSFMLKEQRREGTVNCWYYIKLRPGLEGFLEKMSTLFELHIYTMATRAYALEIAKIVDPDGKYFGDRILSREESGSMVQKNLKRLFPVTTQLVTVIDDRGDVWGWSPHLVRVVPYNFFEGTGDINSGLLPKRSGLITPDGDSSTSAKDEEHLLNENDTELENLNVILSRIHTEFFEKIKSDKNAADIGTLLPSLKEPVFAGCVFLFSGIFPLGVSLENADIVHWVRSFGAMVLAKFVPAVTHVVATNGGTLKTRQAAGAGIPVVSTNWLFACLKEWKRVPVDSYKIKVADPIKPEDVVPEENFDRVDEEEANDPSFAKGFMGGEVDWDAMDKELEEFMTSEDEAAKDEAKDEVEDEIKDETAKHDTASEPTPKTANTSEQRPLKRSRPDDDVEDVDDTAEPETKKPDGHESDSSDSDADLAAELELDFAQSG